jgi:hypothetical protein
LGLSISVFAPGDSSGERPQVVQVIYTPCRRAEPHELIRFDFDLPDLIACKEAIFHLFRDEIEPFVIGARQVRRSKRRKASYSCCSMNGSNNSAMIFAPLVVWQRQDSETATGGLSSGRRTFGPKDGGCW